MKDIEISKALALAIGWKADEIQAYKYDDRLEVWWREDWDANWRIFDYRDWNVSGPIAERYDYFPYKWREEVWTMSCRGLLDDVYADTPQKAIALAVIQGAKT